MVNVKPFSFNKEGFIVKPSHVEREARFKYAYILKKDLFKYFDKNPNTEPIKYSKALAKVLLKLLNVDKEIIRNFSRGKLTKTVIRERQIWQCPFNKEDKKGVKAKNEDGSFEKDYLVYYGFSSLVDVVLRQ